MDTVPITEAASSFSSLVERVVDPDAQPIFISVDGNTKAVLMSAQEYDRLRNLALDREIDSIFDDFSKLNEELRDK